MKRKAEGSETREILKFIKGGATKEDLLRIHAKTLQKLKEIAEARDNPFGKCPNEITVIIFEFVDNWKLVSRICKSWRQAIKQVGFGRYANKTSETTMLWIIASALKRSLISRFVFSISYARSVVMMVERGDEGLDILITVSRECDDCHLRHLLHLRKFLDNYSWRLIEEEETEARFKTSWAGFLSCIPLFALTIALTNEQPTLYTSRLLKDSKLWKMDLKDPAWVLARTDENESTDKINQRLATGKLRIASDKEFPIGDPVFDVQMMLLQRSFWS